MLDTPTEAQEPKVIVELEATEAEAQESDTITAEASPVEAIKKLLKDMGPQKKQMLAIIDYCREMRNAEEIDAMLEPLRAFRTSVYSGIAMRSLLVREGALLYFSNDTNPDEIYDENDGSLVLPEMAVATWLSTPEGIACLEAEADPYDELTAALQDAKVPAEGFALVLSACVGEGLPMQEISHLLEESGILADLEMDPVVYVSQLEDAGALEWRGIWVTTELGKRYLEQA